MFAYPLYAPLEIYMLKHQYDTSVPLDFLTKELVIAELKDKSKARNESWADFFQVSSPTKYNQMLDSQSLMLGGCSFHFAFVIY